MSDTHAIHGSTGGSHFGSVATTKTAWAAGVLAALYVIGLVLYLSPLKTIGLGVPTLVGLLAGACGLFAITIGHDHSWMAWLGVAAAVVALVATVLFV